MEKLKHIFSLFIVLFASIFFFSSCSDDEKDPNPDPKEKEETVNDWIYETMEDWYLWYDDIPERTKLNFSAEPDIFFSSLLSDEDGKGSYYYSYIENTEEKTRNISAAVSHGYEYALYKGNSDEECYIRILYTLPNSPAKDAGLKRGDFISKVNGRTLTSRNYYELINSKQEAKYTLAQYTANGYEDTKTIVIGSARSVEETPFLLDTVYDNIHGKRVAYMIYNSFSLGKDDNDTNDRTYLNEMTTVFNRLKAKQPDEFILDMRYNRGGYVICAQRLASMLVPESNLNKMFVYTKYNDKHKETTEYKFESTGVNMHIDKLYVIGTNYTASASEAVIHGLKPYMDVILIGETTEGKNVGSITFDNDEYPWVLQPIVCKLYNAKNNSDYANGITADVKIDEFKYGFWYDFGDENELLLRTTLSIIEENPYKFASAEESYISTRSAKDYPVISTSIQEKKVKGNIIFNEPLLSQ